MKPIKFLIITMIISQTCFAQTKQKFFFSKQTLKSKVFYSLSGDDSITIAKSGEPSNGVFLRKISTKDNNYSFVINRSDKKCRLLSEDGTELASYPLTGKTKLSITVADGTTYTWHKGYTGRQWRYEVAGKEAFTCAFEKEKGNKYLVYTIRVPDSEGLRSAMLMSHVLGVDLIQAKATEPAIYASIIGLGIMTAVVSASNSPSPDIQ